MSLARRHFQRMSASTAAAAEPQAPIHANAYELQLIALANARRALKQVQSMERKAEVKRRVLPEFLPWVQGVLAADRGGQDDVVMTVMVWAIDVGNIELALEIAAYALRHKLSLPDQYKRDVATLVAEEIAEHANTALAAGTPVNLDHLANADEITAHHDMPDEVRAKLHKARGLAHLALSGMAGEGALNKPEADMALAHLKRAVHLHDRVGVKKEIERLERALKA
jgi:hypothetical protein